jgi:hypothetical protein
MMLSVAARMMAKAHSSLTPPCISSNILNSMAYGSGTLNFEGRPF